LSAADPVATRALGSNWHYLRLGLSWGLLLLVIALAGVVILVPAATGAVPLTVLTSSMEPTLPPGTLVVSRPVPMDQVHLGSVVTYQLESGKPALITHRVIEVRASSDGGHTFVTKGDNNDRPDAAEVQEPQVRGVVWYSIPLLGYVSTAVNGESRAWLIPVIAGALFVYAGYMVLSTVVTARRSKRIPAEAALAAQNGLTNSPT
jgi:signal peptidase I